MKTQSLYLYILFFLSSALFFSCTPDPLDIELPKHESKLVVFSQVIPEHYMIVGVSRSFSALAGEGENLSGDTGFLAGIVVTRALVTIRFADKVEILKHIGGGIYTSTSIHQHYGQTYTLYIRDSLTGLSCTSTSTMLPMVDFDSVKPVVERKAEDTTVYLEYSFSDVPGIDNYYMVNLHLQGNITQLGYASLISMEKKEPNMVLLSDKLLTNGKYTARQKLEVKATDTIAVTLSNISEDYYKFLTAYQKSANLFNQITGEPINYPTNIVNGYGFFNTHNPSIKVFDLNEY